MADNRTVLRTLIQGATVDLFQFYGVAAAPLATALTLPSKLDQYVGGYGAFAGKDINGTLGLLVPKEVFHITKVDGIRLLNTLDLAKELTNQLLGRLKNRLLQYQVTIRSDVPSVIDGKSLELRVTASHPFVTVFFRTIRGELIVTVTGSVDYSKLQYCGGSAAVNEGDIILF